MTDTLSIRGGVDNLFNTEPPLSGGTYAEEGGFTTSPAPNLPTPAAPSNDAR